jgi:hypothetical protein
MRFISHDPAMIIGLTLMIIAGLFNYEYPPFCYAEILFLLNLAI